ncbi:ABC transporter permease [Vibrio sp. JC009]|uniref:ABC transporter permease n=1 Tax=Vibrio sp. JC009 TaxID=2912314 RepID=UPI0023AF4F8A|nr:FtsX-like permease family protein [Vibrio sp. JC009]WED24192.1 ABC transporter permease [Vibrio sp. JC009]
MLVKLAWRNLWRNKLRTSIMLGAMVFGLSGLALMMGFMSGMVDNMIDNAIKWQISHIQIHNHRFTENPDIEDTIEDAQTLITAIEQNPDVKYWSARFVVDGMIGSARSNRGVQINGVDPDAEAQITPLAENLIAGEWLDYQGRNPVLVSEKIASRLRLKTGSKVVLTFTNGEGEVTGAAFRVKGIFKTPSSAFDEGNVLVRIQDLQKVAGMDGVHEIALLLKGELAANSDARLKKVTAGLSNAASDKTLVRSWTQVQPLLASMINTMAVSNAIMLGIFVLAMGFGIVNIMLMSVFERTQEIGVLMAVGMTRAKVFVLIILESFWLGVCGAGLGVAVCILLMSVLQVTGLSLGSMAEGLGAYGVDTLLYPRVSAAEYQVVFISVVLASILAAVYPARQILKKSPAEAMAEKH